MPVNPFVFVLGVFVLMLVARSIVIVPENKRGAVVRLGKYLKTLAPGFHVRVPFIDLVVKVDLDTSIPGWQTLSDRELDAAIESFATFGSVLPTKAVTSRTASAPASETSSGVPASSALADLLLTMASRDTGVDLSSDPIAKQRLAERAASAIEELRSSDSCEINLPFIAADAKGPKHFSTSLTRAQLGELRGSGRG
jgi:hypothetical protein